MVRCGQPVDTCEILQVVVGEARPGVAERLELQEHLLEVARGLRRARCARDHHERLHGDPGAVGEDGGEGHGAAPEGGAEREGAEAEAGGERGQHGAWRAFRGWLLLVQEFPEYVLTAAL